MSLPNEEQWRPIPGFEGYEVSSLGRVRSLDRVMIDALGRRRPFRGAILRDVPQRTDGHRIVSLYAESQRTTARVHALVVLAFVGPRPAGKDGEHIRHLDGDVTNNALANLCYGSASENEQDKLRHGRNRNARKVQCIHGHPFDETNTFIDRKGRRDCRTCRRARWNKASQKRRNATARVVPT